MSIPHIVVAPARITRFDPSCAQAVAAAGPLLGLPIEDLVAAGRIRVTVLSWKRWQQAEWASDYPEAQNEFHGTTLPQQPQDWPEMGDPPASAVVHEIPLEDPWSGNAVGGARWTPRAHLLLSDSDPNLFFSALVQRVLQNLHVQQSVAGVLFSTYGGLGYVPLMLRATAAPGALDVPMALVMQGFYGPIAEANLQPRWTRTAQLRRQGEDWACALADAVVAHGPRACAEVVQRRSDGEASVVVLPRSVRHESLPTEAPPAPATIGKPPAIVFPGYLTGACGALVGLDAAALLSEHATGTWVASGADAAFPPQAPRTFQSYWKSRGWVRNLSAGGRWLFASPDSSDDKLYVHAMPGGVAAEPWATVPALMSADAADGWVDAEALRSGAELAVLPSADAQGVAAGVRRWVGAAPADRAAATSALAASARRCLVPRGTAHAPTAEWLQQWMGGHYARPLLGAVAGLSLDRTRPPAEALAAWQRPTVPTDSSLRTGTLGVVVPCFEMGDMLREAVESLWSSSWRPDQIVVVDDGSPGEATRICLRQLEERAQRHSLPLEVVRQSNAGLPAARNAGLQRITTEWMAFFDGDDILHPWYLEAAVGVLAAHPHVGGVAAWADLMGDGVANSGWNAPQPELPLMITENPVFVPCVLRTAVVKALGGNDPAQRFNYEDWEFSIRVVAAGWPIVTIPLPAESYRVRADSLLRTMNPAQHALMREKLMARHAAVIERFAVPLLLHTEHGRHRIEAALGQRLERLRHMLRHPGQALRLVAERVWRRLR